MDELHSLRFFRVLTLLVLEQEFSSLRLGDKICFFLSAWLFSVCGWRFFWVALQLFYWRFSQSFLGSYFFLFSHFPLPLFSNEYSFAYFKVALRRSLFAYVDFQFDSMNVAISLIWFSLQWHYFSLPLILPFPVQIVLRKVLPLGIIHANSVLFPFIDAFRFNDFSIVLC